MQLRKAVKTHQIFGSDWEENKENSIKNETRMNF